jgi:hypothetical protein
MTAESLLLDERGRPSRSRHSTALPLPPRTRRTPAAQPVEAAPATSRPGRATFILVIVAILSVGLAALLGVNTALAQSSFTAAKLQKRVSELNDQSASLQESLSRSNAPDRLAADATKLGMVPAPGVAYVRLADSSITGQNEFADGEPIPATPEQQAAQAQKAAAEKAKADAKAAKAAQKAAAEQAQADAQRAAREQAAREAAARAAAQAAAARAAAEQQAWQQRLAQQNQGDGGAMLVAPPPERVAR